MAMTGGVWLALSMVITYCSVIARQYIAVAIYVFLPDCFVLLLLPMTCWVWLALSYGNNLLFSHWEKAMSFVAIQ